MVLNNKKKWMKKLNLFELKNLPNLFGNLFGHLVGLKNGQKYERIWPGKWLYDFYWEDINICLFNPDRVPVTD